MELMDFLKIYGPLAIGWIVAAYLLKFILDRYQADIEARVKLATALDGLVRIMGNGNGDKKDA